MPRQFVLFATFSGPSLFSNFSAEMGGDSKCLHDGLPFWLPLVAPCFGRAQVLDWCLIDKDEEKEDLTNKKT